MVKIVQIEHKILKKVAREVRQDEIQSAHIKRVIKDMKKALSSQKDGVAIAAPQIGKSLRIFVISGKILDTEDQNHVKTTFDDVVFINPTITKRSRKKEEMEEGCLSVRWKYGKVKRSTVVTVRAYNETGEIFTRTGTHLVAQIFQHETDHLDGILFVDKARDLHEISPEEREV